MAGLIPQNFIDDVLARLDIVEVISNRIQLRKAGRNYQGLCPFHKEKSPSFSVSPDKQFYYCFGCGASGNAVSFVMNFEHLDFPATIESLAGTLGLDVPHENTSKATIQKRKQQATLFDVMEEINRWFHQQLQSHPESNRVQHYMRQRGLDQATIERFGIGYAPSGWDNQLQKFGSSAEKKQQMLDTGMLIKSEDGDKIYDRFRERVMFPIRDTRGRVIGFGGRVLGNGTPKYLNSPETDIFHKGRELYGLYEAKQANRDLPRLLVVEGYMDVVALAQYGISYAVATLGTATTKEHMEKLFKQTREVVFCFDGDKAGRRAAWRALESTLPVINDGSQVRFLFLPQGEDPDSMVRQEGPDAFSQRIRSEALTFDNYFFRHLAEDIDMQTMDGRARLAKVAQPYLQLMPAGVLKQLVLNRLAEQTGLESEQVTQLFAADQTTQQTPADNQVYAATQTSGYNNNARKKSYGQRKRNFSGGFGREKPFFDAPTPPKPKLQSAASRAIRLLLTNPALFREVEDMDNLSLMEQDSHPDTRLLMDVLQTLQHRPDISSAGLIGRWYGTPQGDRLLALAREEPLKFAAPSQELQDTVGRIVKSLGSKAGKGTLARIANDRQGLKSPDQQQKYQALLEQLRQNKK
ncbi:DNA primase [Spongorhabdus nitratireducens]